MLGWSVQWMIMVQAVMNNVEHVGVQSWQPGKNSWDILGEKGGFSKAREQDLLAEGAALGSWRVADDIRSSWEGVRDRRILQVILEARLTGPWGNYYCWEKFIYYRLVKTQPWDLLNVYHWAICFGDGC